MSMAMSGCSVATTGACGTGTVAGSASPARRVMRRNGRLSAVMGDILEDGRSDIVTKSTRADDPGRIGATGPGRRA